MKIIIIIYINVPGHFTECKVCNKYTDIFFEYHFFSLVYDKSYVQMLCKYNNIITIQ